MQEKLLLEIILQHEGNSLSKVMGIFQQIPIITRLSQNFNKLLGVALQTNMKKEVCLLCCFLWSFVRN